jgi:hypothetical protein
MNPKFDLSNAIHNKYYLDYIAAGLTNDPADEPSLGNTRMFQRFRAK